MSVICSIAITETGIGACILNDQMTYKHHRIAWSGLRQDTCLCIHMDVLLNHLAESLEFLYKESHELPQAIAISVPHRHSACFVDKHHNPISPIYLSMPPIMPKHEIPAQYKDDPELFSAYRNSLIRNIQQTRPEFGLNQKIGLYTLGALVSQVLTGHAADCCLPLGFSSEHLTSDADQNEQIFEASGIDPALTYPSIPCGFSCGTISQHLCRNLHSSLESLNGLAGIPVFMTGSTYSAISYACAADPLSWSVLMGYQLYCGWTADNLALSKYEISIHDQKLPDSPENNEPEPLSRNDWTRVLNENLPLITHPGPRKSLCGFGLETAFIQSPLFEHLINTEDGMLPYSDLSRIPVGSHGLHCIHAQDSFHMIGLKSYHGVFDLMHAYFEGLLFQIMEWRDKIPETPGPVRLVLLPPWPPETLQWIATALQAPVYALDESPETLASIGAALGLMRDLQHDSAGSPSIQAQIIDPKISSYDAHFRVHCALRALIGD